jgi:putrescine aminotransferase
MGVTTGTPAVWEALEPNPFVHSNTFGGNPLACVAGLAALEVLREEDLPAKAAAAGERFLNGLRQLQADFPALVAQVRGKGLMIGVEFVQQEQGVQAAKDLFHDKVLVAHTLNNPRVMRIEPPLAIPDEAIDEVLRRIRGVFERLAQAA